MATELVSPWEGSCLPQTSANAYRILQIRTGEHIGWGHPSLTMKRLDTFVKIIEYLCTS